MRRGRLDPDGLRHVDVGLARDKRGGRGAGHRGPGSLELEKMLERSKANRTELAANPNFAALLASMEAKKRKEKAEDALRQALARDPGLPTSHEIQNSSLHNQVAGVFSMRGLPYVPLGGAVTYSLGPKPQDHNASPKDSNVVLGEHEDADDSSTLENVKLARPVSRGAQAPRSPDLLRASDEIAHNLRLLADDGADEEELLMLESTPSQDQDQKVSGIPQVMRNEAERLVSELEDQHSDDEEVAAEMGLKEKLKDRHPHRPAQDKRGSRTSHPLRGNLKRGRSRRMSLLRLQNAMTAQKSINHVAKLDHKLTTLERALQAKTDSTAKRAHLQTRQRLPLRDGRVARGTRIRPTAILQAKLALQPRQTAPEDAQGDMRSVAADAEERVIKQAANFQDMRSHLQRELRFALLRRYLTRFEVSGSEQRLSRTTETVWRQTAQRFHGKQLARPSAASSATHGIVRHQKQDNNATGLEDCTTTASMRKRAVALSMGASLELSWKLQHGTERSIHRSASSRKQDLFHPSVDSCQQTKKLPDKKRKTSGVGPWAATKGKLPFRGSLYELALFEAAELVPNPADVSFELRFFLGHLRAALGDRTELLSAPELRAVLRAAPHACVHHADCKKLINALAANTAPEILEQPS
ncbi:Hypothetical Protein FCC1311_111982 [Hondaea fermentalgiana]|uniref:Uncharacterized protein n=1 Tax=Hondaea fermentalgiana TaxID=2315210 RepID=A0A2R5GWL7_9STRA|nr:Hypothetical Protein FCC1311_111982 [Hondaea fermentalgiana]|eukprot:GBG34975.1 Hypothetical Protein FCC1311_111982 [Hondaea fermentalgiana]